MSAGRGGAVEGCREDKRGKRAAQRPGQKLAGPARVPGEGCRVPGAGGSLLRAAEGEALEGVWRWLSHV